MNLLEIIENKLKTNLPGSTVKIDDQSSYHRGHSESSDNEFTHLQISIKSAELMKIPSLARHRKVKEILADEFREIHSISLKFM